MNADRNLEILRAQIATAEDIYKSTCKRWESTRTHLVACQMKKKSKCQELLNLCHSLEACSVKQDTKKTMSCRGRNESRENKQLQTYVDDQKRKLGGMRNLVLLLQQDIIEIKSAGVDSDGIRRRQRQELKSLLDEESYLKEECRCLRKELAQARQRHWYQTTPVSNTEHEMADGHTRKPASTESISCQRFLHRDSAVNIPTQDKVVMRNAKFRGYFVSAPVPISATQLQAQGFVSSRQLYDGDKLVCPDISSSTRRYAEVSPYSNKPSPTPSKKKKFTFKKASPVPPATRNDKVFKATAGSSQQHLPPVQNFKSCTNSDTQRLDPCGPSQKDDKAPDFDDSTFDSLPDISCDSDELPPSKPNGKTPENTMQSINALENRMEANKRHFKFFTNF